LSPISNLTNLQYLYLHKNQIVDIGSILNLVNLVKLKLGDNQVANITTLVDNSGIDSGDEIWLENNPLSDTSKNIYIPQLEARGVTIHQ